MRKWTISGRHVRIYSIFVSNVQLLDFFSFRIFFFFWTFVLCTILSFSYHPKCLLYFIPFALLFWIWMYAYIYLYIYPFVLYNSKNIYVITELVRSRFFICLVGYKSEVVWSKDCNMDLKRVIQTRKKRWTLISEENIIPVFVSKLTFSLNLLSTFIFFFPFFNLFFPRWSFSPQLFSLFYLISHINL